MNPVTVVGAGLAGSEAAWQLAIRGIPVRLTEMKPKKMTPAHVSPWFAELVCSNSLRSDELTNAVGLLKEELRRLGSLIMHCADEHRVAAGGALAVDRVGFARAVTDRLRAHPLVEVVEEEVTDFPDGEVIIATGPLTSDAFADTILRRTGSEGMHFYDAVAPIVSLESVDMTSAFRASRYDKGTADYINCPMNAEEYEAFWRELISAREAEVHGFDDAGVFEGCMPVEVMARRGVDTLRFGPLKPVFSMIPALRNADFVRYGVMHRNTYLQSPGLLDRYYRLIGEERVAFAGQITGVEGYVESCASGMLASLELSARLLGLPAEDFSRATAIGALALYVSGGSVGDFQPMNVNFGIIEPLDRRVRGKRNKNAEISRRALEEIGRHTEGELFRCVSL